MEFPAGYVVNMLKAHKVTQTEHALTDCWFVIAVMEGLAELMINGPEYVKQVFSSMSWSNHLKNPCNLVPAEYSCALHCKPQIRSKYQ